MNEMKKCKCHCSNCGADFETAMYSEKIVCPYCGTEAFLDPEEPRLNSWSFSGIKKHRICPNCRGAMVYNKKTKMWNCIDCHYQLSQKDLRKGYVFWFCDECDAYLNVQEGFEKAKDRFVCKTCGFENDITKDNIY